MTTKEDEFYDNLRIEKGSQLDLSLRAIAEARAKAVMEAYDPLIREDSHLGLLFTAKAEAVIRAKLGAEALAGSQDTLKAIVQARFAAIGAGVAKEAVLPDNYEELDKLVKQIVLAPDEKAMRELLGVPID